MDAEPSKIDALLPPPTTDWEQGLRDISEFGLAIIPDVLTGDTLKRTRDALYRAAERTSCAAVSGKATLDYEDDLTNQRVANVLSWIRCSKIAFHPIAIHYLKEVVGWPALEQPFRQHHRTRRREKCRCMRTRSSFPNRGPTSHRASTSHGVSTNSLRTTVQPASCRPATSGTARHATKTVRDRRHRSAGRFGSDLREPGVAQDRQQPRQRPDPRRHLRLPYKLMDLSAAGELVPFRLRPEIHQFATEEMLIMLGYKSRGFGMMNGKSPGDRHRCPHSRYRSLCTGILPTPGLSSPAFARPGRSSLERAGFLDDRA